MNTSSNLDRKFSEQEYFDLLIGSDSKYEYDNGSITMMAGGKISHNQARRNTMFALERSKRSCKIYDSETAVHIPRLKKYYFPDLSAVCGDVDVTDKGGIERLLNPQLLVEVLSKSTETKDTGEKFDAYKTLDSFKEYVIIHSKTPHVLTYYKEKKGLWRIGNYYKMDQEVEFLTLDVKIPMSVIYDGVVFSEDA